MNPLGRSVRALLVVLAGLVALAGFAHGAAAHALHVH